MEEPAIPSHDPELVWRRLEDELVIVRPSDGQIRVLNGVGSLVWQSIDGHRSIVDLAAIVCTEYDTSAQQAEEDIREFLNELIADGLVSGEGVDLSG